MLEVRWADLVGYEGIYKINEAGDILSVRNGRNKILKQYKNRSGYYMVKLYKAKDDKRSYIAHRLVAMQFIPNPYDYPQVNHKDGNTINNHISNLEWVNNRANMNHRYSVMESSDGRYGIHWEEKRNKWMSSIHTNGKKIHLGRHRDKEDAYSAFYNKYREIHGVTPW